MQPFGLFLLQVIEVANAQYKVYQTQPVELGGVWSVSQRHTINGHGSFCFSLISLLISSLFVGIKIIFVQTGVISRFDFQALLFSSSQRLACSL